MGLLGKGNYDFCTDIDLLNEVIATEIGKVTSLVLMLIILVLLLQN